MRRILVCGGRDFQDGKLLADTLDKYQFSCCITGMAKGADSLAYWYAVIHKIPVLAFPADWKQYGKRAGFIRNTQMLVEGKPDLVIAFAGGTGTAMMCRIAEEAGVEVTCVP